MTAIFRLFFPQGDFDNPWKSPLNLSIGLHLLVLAAALVMPALMEHRPRLPEFYTVNLINVTEVPETAAPAQIKPPTPAKIEKESAPPRAVSEQQISIAISEPVRAISIKPVKHKIRRAEESDKRQLEKTRQALLQERKRTEQALKESRAKAAQLAKEAVNKLRRSLQAGAMATPQSARREGENETASSAAAGPVGTGIAVDEAMGRYLAAVFQQIQSHWYIPPLQNWEDSLEAVLVIQVSRTGTLLKTFFEKKSANLYFNQFVYKTVQESAPLPPFPGELDNTSMEIGLRFSPAGVY